MKKIIHHIRSQSEEARRHILHVLTIIFAIILLFLWIFSLGVSLTDPDTEVRINNDLKPFSALKDNLIGGYKSILDQQ
ncbi:hypothetical protein EXS45_01860 [Candidatus Nomurabacteria bacterium]|nr:hypothetical protein [Candidatus Nomurabacteria bacterium]